MKTYQPLVACRLAGGLRRSVPVLLALAATVTCAAAETLVLQGATTVNRRLLEPYKPAIEELARHKLTVIPNKSGIGLIALLEGRANMAMISAPLQGEIVALRKIKPGLPYEKARAFEVARTPVSIAVHPSNPVRTATRDTLRKILLGEIDNWKTLGGPDLPIRVALSGDGGGVTVAAEGVLLEGKPIAAPNVIYLKSGLQVVQVVEQEPSAIAFAQLSLVRTRGIPEVEIDEPIEQILSLVTLGEPTPAMLSVIDAMRSIAAKVM